MSEAERIGRLFDASAERFDAIYSGAGGASARLWDRITRRNIRQRLDFATRAAGSVSGKRVLDVGCGSGRYCVEFARRGAAEVVGLDVSARMLEIARFHADAAGVQARCTFVRADVMEPGAWATSGFDIVVAMGFFDYIDDQVRVLGHLARLSRGQVIASFPRRWALRTPARALWWRRRGWKLTFSTRRELERNCATAHLRPRLLISAGPLLLLDAASVPEPRST
ncbi:MAG: class I SAM-dependent methyltransferase [Vicinamibacterales bacterium]